MLLFNEKYKRYFIQLPTPLNRFYVESSLWVKRDETYNSMHSRLICPCQRQNVLAIHVYLCGLWYVTTIEHGSLLYEELHGRRHFITNDRQLNYLHPSHHSTTHRRSPAMFHQSQWLSPSTHAPLLFGMTLMGAIWPQSCATQTRRCPKWPQPKKNAQLNGIAYYDTTMSTLVHIVWLLLPRKRANLPTAKNRKTILESSSWFIEQDKAIKLDTQARCAQDNWIHKRRLSTVVH